MSAIALSTGTATPVVVGLDLGSRVVPGALPNGVFTGVAVADDGSIYVSADGSNAVYEFAP